MTGMTFMAPPEISMLRQHAVVADNASTIWRRRLDAAVANAGLECLESLERRQRRGGPLRLDEVDETIVFKPQHEVTNAFWRLGRQFLEDFCDQSRVLL